MINADNFDTNVDNAYIIAYMYMFTFAAGVFELIVSQCISTNYL